MPQRKATSKTKSAKRPAAAASKGSSAKGAPARKRSSSRAASAASSRSSARSVSGARTTAKRSGAATRAAGARAGAKAGSARSGGARASASAKPARRGAAASAASTARKSAAKGSATARKGASSRARGTAKATAAPARSASAKGSRAAAKAPARRGATARRSGRRGGRLRAEIEANVVDFGERLRAYRKQAGLSQLALAEGADVDLAAISFLERAKRAPNLGTLVRVARAVGVPPAVLADAAAAKAYGLPKVSDEPLPRGRAGATRVRRRARPKGAAARARKSRVDATPLKRFGANLRRARIDAGLSQERLAGSAELDRAAISIIERGGRSANLRTLLKLAWALEKSPAELLEGIE